jgi:hypothetical protein
MCVGGGGGGGLTTPRTQLLLDQAGVGLHQALELGAAGASHILNTHAQQEGADHNHIQDRGG